MVFAGVVAFERGFGEIVMTDVVADSADGNPRWCCRPFMDGWQRPHGAVSDEPDHDSGRMGRYTNGKVAAIDEAR